jgi:hypothetical protein
MKTDTKRTVKNKSLIVYRERCGRRLEAEVFAEHMEVLTYSNPDDPSLPYVSLAPQQAADFARWVLDRAIELGAK